MNKIGKKIRLFCGIGLCAITLLATSDINVYASEAVVVEENETRSTNLEWFYKEVDGVMYMRLYNHSTGEWETDWMVAW